MAAVATLMAALQACGQPSERTLTLATTTSVQNSGLLDVLVPAFRDEAGIQVRAHLAGSGRALQMVARGDADVAISHAPEAETAALGAHPDWMYRKVMFNDFVIVGPGGDPANVRQAPDAVDTFRRIAKADVWFASRGDQSGTHEREQALWALAAVRPPPERLLTTGSSMAQTLRAASTQRAYTLTDRSTFLQLRNSLELEIVHEGDTRLLNTYAVIVAPGSRQADAMRLADWLSSGHGRSLIAGYKVGGTTTGFHVWPSGCPAATPSAQPCPRR